MRRTPLTDLLSNHPKLGTLKLGTLKPSGLSRRGKSLAYGGTALALAGIGGVTAAAATSAAPGTVGIAGTSHNLGVADAAGARTSLGVSIKHGPAAAAAHSSAAAASAGAAHDSGHALSAGRSGSAQAAGASGHSPAAAASGSARVAAASGSARVAAAVHSAPTGPRVSGAFGHLKVSPKSPHVVRHGSARSWKQIRDELAGRMSPRAEPGKLPLADRLVTGPASGSQSYLPMTSSRMDNATAIVRQALGRRMGLRAAVIAVATAMQESGLENINYGDRDSLGLFQQRPSMGWGSASQITTPSYAADAFLSALAAHQKADPGWAGQPLWATAQAVQKSGFPYAYAKWEKQAAQLVSAIATKLG